MSTSGTPGGALTTLGTRRAGPAGLSRVWLWLVVLGLNLALSVAAALLAPGEARVSHTADRAGYEFVGAHPLESPCPHSIYCYRLLVPVTLEAFPGTPLERWRGFALVANTLTGVAIAAASVRVARARSDDAEPRHQLAPMVIASIAFQTSFGATFALFDPFTPDAAVYLAAAVMTWLWLRDQAWLVMAVALVGVWAKETVALVGAILAIAALLTPRRRTRARAAWLVSGAVPAVAIVIFHIVANRALGWSEAGSGSADLAHGAWLARWLADATLTPASRAFYLFIPFGLGWLYAVFGLKMAGPRLRALAFATLIVIPVLVYLQTPERALANAFIAVVPLVTLFLARIPWPLGVTAVLSNGLLTARVGLATDRLPPVPYGLVLATIVGTLTLVWALAASRRSSVAAIGSSAPLASSR